MFRVARPAPLLAVIAATALALPLEAQDHAHPADGGKLGTVHFPTSCARATTSQFDRAIALLHSFEFRAAIHGFEEVLASDSTCAMAHWGIALSRWTNPMVPNIRPVAVLERGRASAETAARLAVRTTPRERGYIAAVAELYADHTTRDQRTRLLAYEAAMAKVARETPGDTEARIFHALALVAAAPPTDKTYQNQLKAGATLERLFARQPDHPGLAHYIIHSYDVPALAGRAAAAARAYAGIAPAASHALHMPSHTFTRVGLWEQSVATNLRSMDAALRDASFAEALHAADYAVYAYLQVRQDSAAAGLVRRLPELTAKFDPAAVTGAAPGSAGVFAIAAMPARYALERRAWKEAVALPAGSSDFPYAEAMTHFARALGAARTGDLSSARAAVGALKAIEAKLLASRELYWAEQVAIQALGAEAWVDFAEGRSEAALRKMATAATREDATEKAAVSPGPLVPARELLGEMLLEAKSPVLALEAFEQTLTREPNRYRALDGARLAAIAASRPTVAAKHAQAIERLTRWTP